MDQTPADQPSSDPPGGPGGEGIPEQELLDVLAEASKLAAELSVQLDGAPDPPPMDEAPSLVPKSTKVEDQIDDLDAILAATCNELGEADPSPNENFGWDEGNSVEGGESSVPDFMDEFTHPEGGEKPSTAEAPKAPDGIGSRPEKSSPMEPRPGVVGTGMVGLATEKKPEPQPVEQDEPPAKVSLRDRINPRELPAKLAGLAASAAQGLLEKALPAAEKVVGILEKGDRPLAKLKAPVKQVIGWLAIATLGTSAFVFFWTLV